jgi:NifU-like protein
MHTNPRNCDADSELVPEHDGFSATTGVYCTETDELLSSIRCAGVLTSYDAEGLEVRIDCGSWVRFQLVFDKDKIQEVKFTSNGCGVMITSAESLARRITGKRLTDLGGTQIELAGSAFDSGRQLCIEAALSSLKRAFAAYREKRIADAGETAIACTCFGVSIDTIECVISNGASSVEDVSKETRAGGGCGSCRMLIQEILDGRRLETTAL